MENLTPASTITRLLANIEATELHHDQVAPEHLFLALCRAAGLTPEEVREYAEHLKIKGQAFDRMEFEFGQVHSLMEAAQLDPAELREALRSELKAGEADVDQATLHPSPECQEIYRIAGRLSRNVGSFRILPLYLLWALLLDSKNRAYAFLGERGVNLGHLTHLCEGKAQETFTAAQRRKKKGETHEEVAEREPASEPEREAATRGEARKRSNTPFLERYGRDLTARVVQEEQGPIVGRGEEIAEVCRGLVRQDKSAVMLIGEAGVGKTAIVEGLAQAIVKEQLPPALRKRFEGVRIIEVSMGALVAGSQYRGEFEERVQRMLREATQNRDSVVLFIDEIHTMMGAGAVGSGGMDAANLLKPAIGRGDIRLIGATTVKEYTQHIERDSAMERRFAKVYVNEPGRDETVAIINGLRGDLEKHYEVRIDEDAVTAAVDLTMRHLPNQRLPAKALDALHQACANCLCSQQDGQAFWSDPTASRPPSGNPEVTREEVAKVVSGACRIPLTRLLARPERRVGAMQGEIREAIVGQDEAVKAVCDCLLRAQLGLTPPDRPDGVFLLLGPTGVGKTELAKAVARSLFGEDPDHFVALDMSEYQQPQNVSRLIGAAPGLVGYNEGGVLTEAVRRQPYCAVLFDEIEKAHPDVFDIFLQIFEEGRLTDNQGRRADFRHALVFLTSNIGASVKPARMGIGLEASEDHDMARSEYRENILKELRRNVRMEIINRIDNVIVFDPLNREAQEAIADRIFAGWRRRLLEEKKIGVELSPEARAHVIEKGYSDLFGARELRRVIEQSVLGALSRFLADPGCGAGDELTIVLEDGELVARKAENR